MQHLELAAHVGLNMYNCYAIDGLKSAIMAASLRCPGFATLLLNLGLPPIPGPKAFDAQVSARHSCTEVATSFFFVQGEAGMRRRSRHIQSSPEAALPHSRCCSCRRG